MLIGPSGSADWGSLPTNRFPLALRTNHSDCLHNPPFPPCCRVTSPSSIQGDTPSTIYKRPEATTQSRTGPKVGQSGKTDTWTAFTIQGAHQAFSPITRPEKEEDTALRFKVVIGLAVGYQFYNPGAL